MSFYYDAFFLPGQVPTVGPLQTQCTAAVGLRNPGGVIVQWHCQLSKLQWDYHKTRNGKEISKVMASVTKKLSYVDPVEGAKTKDIPVHMFAGTLGVYDPSTKKIMVAAGKPDIDLGPTGPA